MQIRIATLNIGHGMGKPHIWLTHFLQPHHLKHRLHRMADILFSIRTNHFILCLQEVDVRSWTTFKNNIVEFFGLHLGLDHIVFGREIIQGIGIVGNAILSNMPITACTRHIVHGKRKRSVLQALVKKKLQLITTHLEPYDHIVRERQMKALLHVHHSSLPTLIAGDLNSIPLGAMQKKMLGYGKNDYSGDQTLKLLIRSRRFHTVQPLFDYIAGKPTILDKKFFTFPTAGYTPNRVLDYILASQDIKFLTYTTQYMHDTDHALLYADVKI